MQQADKDRHSGQADLVAGIHLIGDCQRPQAGRRQQFMERFVADHTSFYVSDGRGVNFRHVWGLPRPYKRRTQRLRRDTMDLRRPRSKGKRGILWPLALICAVATLARLFWLRGGLERVAENPLFSAYTTNGIVVDGKMYWVKHEG